MPGKPFVLPERLVRPEKAGEPGTFTYGEGPGESGSTKWPPISSQFGKFSHNIQLVFLDGTQFAT